MPGFERRKLAFIDTETTGLDPELHEIWEIGLIQPGSDRADMEWRWLLPVDVSRADPEGLRISGFHERHPQGDRYTGTEDVTPIAEAMRTLSPLIEGRHLAGAVVSFDALRLERLMRSVGMLAPWHYHLCDVENLAAGFIMGRETCYDPNTGRPMLKANHSGNLVRTAQPPWDSEELSRAVGVEPNEFDRHTALGDARWARAVYDACMTR